MAEVQYTEPALLDLDSIEQFIISRSDTDTATNFINELNETFHLLAEMPKMGRACNDLQRGYECLFTVVTSFCIAKLITVCLSKE
jgi:plasmid stabilization system protein ParE